MGRQAKRCPKKCTRHLFSLKPVHYSAFFSRQSQCSYCPSNFTSQGNMPKFNRDGKPYTAAFILAGDQLKLQENDKLYQIEHERFKKLNHQEKTEILIPKPKSKSSYCNICKEVYDDYADHISSLKHKQTIKENSFNDQILSLCQFFGNHLPRSSKTILPEDFFATFTQKASQETLSPVQSNQFQIPEKEKSSIEEPELFLQKLVKDNLEVINFCGGVKSFHSYIEMNAEKAPKELKFLNYEFSEIKNDNKFLTQCGGFKYTEQTASPIKTKFERPIILMGQTLKLDE